MTQGGGRVQKLVLRRPVDPGTWGRAADVTKTVWREYEKYLSKFALVAYATVNNTQETGN